MNSSLLRRWSGTGERNWQSSDCSDPSSYVQDLSMLVVARWDNSQWINAGQSSSSGPLTAGSITSNTLTAGGYLTLGTTSMINVLPIELYDFDSEAGDVGTRVFWETMTESNSDFFST